MANPVVMLSLLIVFMICITSLWHVKETFVSPIAERSAKVIKDVDDKRCKFVHDRYPNKYFAMMDGYRLLTYEQPDTCYMKMSDTMISGGECSKNNPAVYKQEFKDVVEDIYFKPAVDGSISDLAETNACVIKFNPKNSNYNKLAQYVQYLGTKDPELLKLNEKINDIEKQNEALTSEYNALVSKYRAALIQNTDLDTKTRSLTDRNKSLRNELNNLKGQYAKRLTLREEIMNPPQPVKLYEHCNYEGRVVEKGIGKYDMNAIGLPNDSISSIRVPPGRKIRIYEHAGFGGLSKEVTSDISCLVHERMDGNRTWNDQISSFEVV